MIPAFPIFKAILVAGQSTIALTKVLTWHHCLSSGDGCHGNKQIKLYILLLINIIIIIRKFYIQ